MTYLIIDTISKVLQSEAVSNPKSYVWLEIILKNNPGILTLILTGLILPISLVYINNKHNKSLKELEKDLELKFNQKDDIRIQEKIVYSSLSKVLFNIQQLHVSLSGSCIDEDCITKSLEKFENSIGKYHDEISNNMLFLSSEVINLIYKFYKEVSELKIELTELNSQKKYDMAHVAVYLSASELAGVIIDIQGKFIETKSELRAEFDKTKQNMMRYCCGRTPPKELTDKYALLKEEMYPKIC